MYEDKRLPEFCQMEKIAWEIRTKSAGSVAGFVTVLESGLGEETELPEEIPAASQTK